MIDKMHLQLYQLFQLAHMEALSIYLQKISPYSIEKFL